MRSNLQRKSVEAKEGIGNGSWALRRLLPALLLLALAGCAGAKTQAPDMSGYVEVTNPSYTLNPNASPTMWVPREYVEKGPSRAGDYVKSGYESMRGARAAAPAPAAPPAEGRQARKLPHFVPVAAVDGDRVYFNLGAEGNYVFGQELRVFKGKTVKEVAGPVPGDQVGTIEIRGYVGSKSGYGVVKSGGPLSPDDLVEVE